MCYAKPVTIGHDCWFGANVVVCPGVTIGENCVIGAGSVVTRDIPAGSFAAEQSGPGHPPDYGGGYRPRPLPRHPGNKTEGLDNSSRSSQSIEKVFSTDC
ncbi:MAG: DapH/DapD/GlmU-related protein [Flavonifractor plautii]